MASMSVKAKVKDSHYINYVSQFFFSKIVKFSTFSCEFLRFLQQKLAENIPHNAWNPKQLKLHASDVS